MGGLFPGKLILSSSINQSINQLRVSPGLCILDFLLHKPKIFLWFKLGLLLLAAKIISSQFSCQRLKIRRFHITICITSVSWTIRLFWKHCVYNLTWLQPPNPDNRALSLQMITGPFWPASLILFICLIPLPHLNMWLSVLHFNVCLA